jgi:hypothetical protein
MCTFRYFVFIALAFLMLIPCSNGQAADPQAVGTAPPYCHPCLFYGGDFDAANPLSGSIGNMDTLEIQNQETEVPFRIRSGQTWTVIAGAGPALPFACATTNEAAPAFVVFESWAPHSLRAGLSSRHIHGVRLCANRSSCPISFAATTVQDISISLRPVVISGSLCSRGHRIAICCFVSWRGYGGDTISW